MNCLPILTLDPQTEAAARRAFNNRFADQPVPDGKAIVEDLATAFADFKAAYDEKFEALQAQNGNVKLTAMQDQIDRLETILNRPTLWGGTGTLDGVTSPRAARELSAAFRHFARTGDESRLNAMTTVSDPDGGYLVIPERSREMTKKLFDASPMRRLCRVVTLTASGSFEEPIDRDDASATWVNEIESRTEDGTPQLGLLTIPAEETYALVPLSQKLLDDSDIDLWDWMTQKITDKFARQEGQAFVSGDGVKKPQGFLSYPVSSAADASRAWGTLQYVVSGAASTITADGLIDLVYSLRAPYRRGACWLLSSDTARIVSKLKDSNGDYLWRESLSAGQPSTLLGYPVEYSEDMPAVAADAYPMAFGNFKLGYTIVDRLGIRFLRDPYSKKPFVLVYAYRRVGGGMNNSETIKLLKIAA